MWSEQGEGTIERLGEYALWIGVAACVCLLVPPLTLVLAPFLGFVAVVCGQSQGRRVRERTATEMTWARVGLVLGSVAVLVPGLLLVGVAVVLQGSK